MTASPPTRASSSWWLRILAVFAGGAAIWLGLGILGDLIFGADYSYAVHTFRACATLVLVLVLLRLVLHWEGKPATAYGLIPNRQAPAGFGLGATSYLVPFAVAGLVILGVGAASISTPGTPAEVAGQLVAVLVLVLLYEAIPEELIFRGYFFTTLAERFPTWVAIVGQAGLFCAFGVVIGAARTPDRFLLFLLFALSLGFIRAATGSVFVTMGFHASFQLAGQPLLGSQWTAISLDDPDRWFADLALGLSPFIFAPIIALLIVKATGRHKLGVR